MRNLSVIMLVVFFVCLAGLGQADVVVKHKSTTDVAGLMSMQIDGTDIVKGDRSCTETTSKVTGGMMAMMGKGKAKEIINITRLDKGVYWEIDPEAKEYRESTLESLKQDLNKSKEKAQKENVESDYTWTVDVKNIDTPQNINGFDCKGVIGKATGIKKKEPIDTIYITFEQWSAQNVPGASEVEEYHKNYARAVGADEMWAQQNMGQMLSEYGNQFESLAAKMSEIGGFPIKTIMSVENSTAQAKSDDGESAMNSKDIMSKMSGMFGKKNDASNEGGEKSETKAEAGRSKAFMMTNEVTSVEQKPANDSQFEVPAGFKKD